MKIIKTALLIAGIIFVFLPYGGTMAVAGENYFVIKSVNIRANAGTEFEKLGVLKQGERVQVVGRAKNGNWLEVSRSGTKLGFVYHSFLKAELSPSPLPSKATTSVKSASASQLDSLLGGKNLRARKPTISKLRTIGGGLDNMLNNMGEELKIAKLERQIQAEIKAEQNAVRRDNQRVAKIQRTAGRCNRIVDSISSDLEELGELLGEFECSNPNQFMYPIAKLIRQMGFRGLAIDFARACIEKVDEERDDMSDDIKTDIESFRDGDCKGDDRHRYLRKALNGINGNISNSLEYYSDAVASAKNQNNAYRRQEDRRMRAEGQKWLSDLQNTSKAYYKQNQQMMKDTAAAYNQSIQIRNQQDRRAQQELNRRQLAQQQQIQAQNDRSRQQMKIERSNTNTKLAQLKKQHAEAIARLQRKQNQTSSTTNRTAKSANSKKSGGLVLGSKLDPGAGSTAKSQKNEIEALAFCWQNDHQRWRCDGKIQRQTISVDSLEEALGFVRCQNYRKQEAFKNGHIYFCGDEMINLDWDTGKSTPNRDIAAWYPLPPSILNQRRKGG